MVELALLAIGATLMCIGVRWLFFFGLALAMVSGLFSVRPRTPVVGRGGFAGWIIRLGALALFMWKSSCGRHPLSWSGACAGVFAFGLIEFGQWRGSRSVTTNG
jgi:hypothetical protein